MVSLVLSDLKDYGGYAWEKCHTDDYVPYQAVSEPYSELGQTSKMELFAKIVNGWKKKPAQSEKLSKNPATKSPRKRMRVWKCVKLGLFWFTS